MRQSNLLAAILLAGSVPAALAHGAGGGAGVPPRLGLALAQVPVPGQRVTSSGSPTGAPGADNTAGPMQGQGITGQTNGLGGTNGAGPRGETPGTNPSLRPGCRSSTGSSGIPSTTPGQAQVPGQTNPATGC